MSELLDAIVVGAGQAGLAASYFLQRDGRRHLVLERGGVGETWLSQRWESFQLNTPNFMNALPGLPYHGTQADGFWRQDDLVAYYQEYSKQFQLPIRTGIDVLSLERADGACRFILTARADRGTNETLFCRAVIVASGIQRTPRMPALQSKIPASIVQMHTAAYRSPGALPPGAVLVVGSAQSGCQIAEDLVSAGRKVYLCTGKAGRIPRRYRGRDSLEWWIHMGIWEIPYASLEDKAISLLPVPQISGVGRYGHSLSLQALARQGAVILGRLQDVDEDTLILAGDAAANVLRADEFSQRFKEGVDAYIEKSGIEAPPSEADPGDEPDPDAACASLLTRLDLREADIRTIIWATGFTGDFRWIHLPVIDLEGLPIHERGVSPVPGVYFLGFPWLSKRKSGIIYGVADDAQYITGVLAKQLMTGDPGAAS